MKIFGYSVEECITFFMLVVVGYFIAKLFSQKCNGFSVGAQINCEGMKNPAHCLRYSRYCELKDGKCTNKNAPAPPPPPPAEKKDPGSGCNNNNDCKSGYCNMNVHNIPNFNGMCDIKQECDNNQQKYPRCNECINDNLQFPDCTKCKNNNKLKPPNCTECIQKLMNPKDNCQSHIPCEDIKDSSNCDYSENAFGLCKWVNNECIKLKKFGDPCEKNNECQSGVCHHYKGAIQATCRNCSDVNVATCEVSPSLDGHGDVCKVTGKGLNRECTRK